MHPTLDHVSLSWGYKAAILLLENMAERALERRLGNNREEIWRHILWRMIPLYFRGLSKLSIAPQGDKFYVKPWTSQNRIILTG